eukprot:1157922-Ditylum_brightwellii.AAC.1
MEKVGRVINKEDRNCSFLPLPCWIARFNPHLHMTPQGLIVKHGKNDSCSLCPVVTPLAVTQALPTGNPLGDPGRLWPN